MENNTIIFKGPQYYKEEDKEYFFGRKEETESLLYMVKHNDFVVCYAESGEGKSSLINAGLIPRMRTENMFPVRIQFNDNDFAKTPTRKTLNNKNSDKEINFDEFVWEKIVCAIDDAKTKEQYKTLLLLKTQEIAYNESGKTDKELKDSIWLKLRENELRLNSYQTVIPVLIFDQFEEIFTRSKDINWTDEFFKWLENLYKDEVPGNVAIGCIPKRFKVILSLRSDFVSELDYWSMRKYFIPSLKNNRYCLKALTKDSAKEIASKLESLPNNVSLDDIINAAKIERVGNIDEVKDDLPCISALVLSLILTEFDKDDDKIIEKIETLSSGENDESDKIKYSEDFLVFIINHVYEKALEKCGIYKDSQLRVRLEEALIDSNGRRRRVSLNDKELQDIPKEKLEKLEKERIINKIGNDVEISHDCLRKVIEIHNQNRVAKLEEEKRKAEQAKLKAIRQKHNVYLFISLFFAFCSSYLYLYFYSYDVIVPYFARKVGAASPYEVIKEVVLASAFVFIPTILASYIYLRKWGKLHIRNISRIFVFLLFVYSVFVFYDLVFCPIQSASSSYSDSALMTLIVPLLYFSTYQNKNFWHYLVYLVMLIPIMLNAFCLWNIPFVWLIIYLLFISAFVIFSFSVCKICLWKKILWSFSNIIVLFASVCFQLGYNPIAVDYDQVIRRSCYTLNWKTVLVKSSNNKFGVLSFSGDTIVPCAFFYVRNTIPSEISSASQYGGKVLTLDLSKNKNVQVDDNGYMPFYIFGKKLVYNLDVLSEFKIIKYADWDLKDRKHNNLNDSSKYYASLVYKEIRNEIIRCIVNNDKPKIDNIPNIDKLDSLNKINTKLVLPEKNDTSHIKLYITSLNDAKINKLYRAISTDLNLCTIRDRFINEDINGIIKQFQFYYICHFLENINQNINYNANEKAFNKNFKVALQGLKNNNSYDYSRLLYLITIYDVEANYNRIEKIGKDTKKNINSLQVLYNKMKNIDKYIIETFMREINRGESFTKAYNKINKYYKIKSRKFIDEVADTLNQFNAYDYYKTETSFKKLSDMTFDALIPCIEDEDCVNYFSSLVDICKDMTKVCAFRWNEEAEKYIQKLEKLETGRLGGYYERIKEIIDVSKKYNESIDEVIIRLNEFRHEEK